MKIIIYSQNQQQPGSENVAPNTRRLSCVSPSPQQRKPCHHLRQSRLIRSSSSGIAALLHTGGRTAHSKLKIPLKISATCYWDLKYQSIVAELIRRAEIILWDEAQMTHRHAFEALDRTLTDIAVNFFKRWTILWQLIVQGTLNNRCPLSSVQCPGQMQDPKKV